MMFWQICLVEGASGDLIPKMQELFGIKTFDFVFLDHWKDRYLPDIKLLEVKKTAVYVCNYPFTCTVFLCMKMNSSQFFPCSFASFVRSVSC